MILLTYAGFKLSQLVGYEDYKVQLREINQFYEDTDKLEASDGLMIAAGLTAYDGSSEVIEDQTVGRLVFYWKRWGLHKLAGNNEIETRLCKEDDFNDVDGSNEKSLFFKLRERD